MIRMTLLLLASLLAFAGAASADFETVVNGDLEIDVIVDDVTTEADYMAPAETDIGSINHGSYVNGDADIYVSAYDVTTKADYKGQACTSIGSVGGCLNQERE